LGELEDLAPREQALVDRLQACHDRRTELLAQALKRSSTPTEMRAIDQVPPDALRREQTGQARTAESCWRLLSHQSLANWALIQRTLLDLSRSLVAIAENWNRPRR
jgi:hypothetical protein